MTHHLAQNFLTFPLATFSAFVGVSVFPGTGANLFPLNSEDANCCSHFDGE